MDIKRARYLLGSGYENVSDKELKNLIDILKSVWAIIVEGYLKERNGE